MNIKFLSLISSILCVATILHAQVPSVQLKIKEKSGFLGMGGPRTVKIELSNQNRQQPLTSDNVNDGRYFYFLVTPFEDWQLDEDFVKEELTKISIDQDGNKIPIVWKSDLIMGENNALLLGFSKVYKLNLPFSFQYPIDKVMNQTVFTVPQELWPGFTTITNLMKKAETAVIMVQFKSAIGFYEQILGNTDLQIFPQYEESKKKRTQCYDSFQYETSSSFKVIANNTQIDLKSRIVLLDGFKPNLKMILDSLPRIDWNIGSLDSAIAPILNQCRNSLIHLNSIHDSLQHVLDNQNILWITEGSATGKNGYLFEYMIETLASAFSSLNFTDTLAPELKVKISEEYQTRLDKYDLKLSYETFIRICNERYQTHLPIFPIGFLPNLKKDSITFPLPYYSMFKAVNDYYYGDFASTKKEIINIFRTNYEPDINSQFDIMRVAIANREQHIPPDVMKILEEAEQFEKSNNLQNAQDKYRQVTLVAPNFANGFFMLGKFYSRMNDLVQANYSFQQAYQIDSLYLSAYRENYGIFLKQGNFKEIINMYSAALSKGNNYWEINYNMGIAFLGWAYPARAIQSFEHALSLNPKSYTTNIQIGLAHQKARNFKKAREYFNNAISLDPTRQEAVNYLTKLNELQRIGR